MNTDQYLSCNISLVFRWISILQTHLWIVFPASMNNKQLETEPVLMVGAIVLDLWFYAIFLNPSENQIPQNTHI